MTDAEVFVQDKWVRHSKFGGMIHTSVQTGSGVGRSSLTLCSPADQTRSSA